MGNSSYDQDHDISTFEIYLKLRKIMTTIIIE